MKHLSKSDLQRLLQVVNKIPFPEDIKAGLQLEIDAFKEYIVHEFDSSNPIVNNEIKISTTNDLVGVIFKIE